MFKSTKFKKVLVTTLVLVMGLTTVAVAANNIYTKQLTATYGRIKFNVNGKDVTKEIESKYNTPAFTVDERSYVPVRAISELVGMKVEYDNNTHTAILTDTKDIEHQQELAKKDEAILKLNNEIKSLNAELKKLKDGIVDKDELKDLEKKLNKDYGQADGVYFSISLKESKDKITITMDIDTKDTYQKNSWRKMSVREKQNLIEDVVGDVSKNFKDFKIEGTLYDTYDKQTLYSFTLNSNGKVGITNRDYGDGRYGDILYDAEDYLDYYFSDISRVVKINIKERYDGEIYGTLDIDEDRYRLSDWDIEDAFYRAEDDLIYKYGNGTYLDIELYLNGNDKKHGTYYNGRFN